MRARKKELPIGQALRNVENHIKRFIEEISKSQNGPRKQLYKDMIFGMLQSGSTQISRMARHIKDRCQAYHSKEKRLSYELQKGKWGIEASKEKIHEKIRGTNIVGEETIFAVDFTDIEKNGGHVFEHLDRVHDGSTGKIVNGYWVLVIEAIKKQGGHVPLYLQMFSCAAKGFKSMNAEVYKGVKEVVRSFGQSGWWVMDRGFDSHQHFIFFIKQGLKFIIRGCHGRIVETTEGIRKNINTVVEEAQLKGHHPFYHYYVQSKKGNRCKWEKRQSKVAYGYLRVFVPCGGELVEMTVVIFEGVGKAGQRSYFYTNYLVTSLQECLLIGKRYGLRWGCEEEIRFMKQELSLEDMRVQNYCSLQRMVFFVYATTVAIWYVEWSLRKRACNLYQWILDLVCNRKIRPKCIMYKFLEAVQKILYIKELAPYFQFSFLGKL